MNQLISVTYRPGPAHPPVQLICQTYQVGEEVMLWVDGINLEDPLLVPLSSVRGHKLLGTFREFAGERLEVARDVLHESQGEHSPAILARAMQAMQLDSSLSAREALDEMENQALDLIDADTISAQAFAACLDSTGLPVAA